MKNWHICILLALVMIAACSSTEVEEQEQRSVVQPNVAPAPPMEDEPEDITPPTPSVEPTPAPVQPVEPAEPIQPVAPAPVEPVQPVTPAPVEPSQPQPQPDTSEPDWMNKTVRATGQSAVDPKYAARPGQAKLMAKRGAELDAKRQLLEQVLGLRLQSKTVVKDMVADTDEVKAQTSGLIRRCYVVGKNFDGSVYTVTVELKLYDVYTYMKTKKIYYK